MIPSAFEGRQHGQTIDEKFSTNQSPEESIKIDTESREQNEHSIGNVRRSNDSVIISMNDDIDFVGKYSN
jgi:hypothetical protein